MTEFKRRADKFLVACDCEAIETIQSEVLKYKEYLDKIKEEADASGDMSNYYNSTLTLYLRISMDEGYRRVIKELRESYSDIPDMLERIKAKPKSYNVIEYIDEGEDEALFPLIMRRIKSKRQRKKWAEDCKNNPGRGDGEEWFTLSMVINTGFEHGYLKANTIEEISKMVCKNEDMANIVTDMLNGIFKSDIECEYNNQELGSNVYR